MIHATLQWITLIESQCFSFPVVLTLASLQVLPVCCWNGIWNSSSIVIVD